MKEQIKIPTGKVQRATKFIQTGAKIGGNYIKHYSRKIIDKDTSTDKLHIQNAEDIYDSLSKLKGSALKVLQMMSLDRNFLPEAYQDKFSLAQSSAPPLSFPLVVNTFKKGFGKSPDQLFDRFDQRAVNAASIGQVHRAALNGKELAVKIQYPGVADSISSDLKIVKPFARLLFNVSDADIDYYLKEVENKLIEETDYKLELNQSIEISNACQVLDNLLFPKYYPEYSSNRIITMDWMEGMYLDDFLESNPSQEIRNKAGQSIWDFYDFQIHALHKVHADAHPGNFLFQKDGTVEILDFGCVKEIPMDYYSSYFKIHNKALVLDEDVFEDWLYELSFIRQDDSSSEKELFKKIFTDMAMLLARPFHEEVFDFSDNAFFNSIYQLGENVTKMKEVRTAKSARGSKHGLYVNRTYFGLYQLLNTLSAKVHTGKSKFNKLVA